MTETQAKSGTAGTSTNPPVDEDAASGGGAPATGRTAVGRAAVPADAPSPKFTRAPGMPPPPDQLPTEPSGAPVSAGDDDDATRAESSTPAGAATPPATGATGGSEPNAGSSRTDQPSVGGPLKQSGLSSLAGRSGTPTPAGRSGAPTPAGQTGVNRTDRLDTSVLPGSEASRPGAAPQAGPGTGRRGGSPPSAPGQYGVGASARTAGGTGAGAVGAARVTEAVRAARTSVSSAASRGPRRARLNLKRIDPWSVMKFSFAVSLVLFIVVIVATSVLYLALDAMGVFDSVNGTLTDMIKASGSQGDDTFRITAKGVILTSGLIGLVNVVLFTALATLGAFIYNVCADLVGGIELTLAERD